MSKHPHDGLVHCRQATETVAEFLQRLPPSTTKAEDVGPWIRIANRDCDIQCDSKDIACLIETGKKLLGSFAEKLAKFQAEHPKNQTEAALTRKINAERRKQEADLLRVAHENNVRIGKWMLFPSPKRVDEVWSAIAHAIATGSLGVGAKVATDSGNRGRRLICVYTNDISDKEDIRRVLLKLVDMGLVECTGRQIYYKCDAYSYLDIKSGNVWGLKPTMYSSTDIMARKW
ncbi:hypothetical protein VTO42DRAFT_3498 [Malbranchea cinnamomea]